MDDKEFIAEISKLLYEDGMIEDYEQGDKAAMIHAVKKLIDMSNGTQIQQRGG